MADVKTKSTPTDDTDQNAFRGVKVGRILNKQGKATRDQIQEALAIQKQRRAPLGQLLVELGHCSQSDINLALAAQAGMPVVDLDEVDIPEEVIRQLPSETAMSFQTLPVQYDAETNSLTVAVASADNFQALDSLRLLMGYSVTAVIAPADQLSKRLDTYYGENDESLMGLIGQLAEDDEDFEEFMDRGESIDLDSLMEAAEDNKVKRLLNLVLLQAIKDKASDIHFEPFEDEFKMRYRIDGVLYEMIPPPRALALPIVSRIKVMSKLNIAERRLPQDGRIELMVNGQPVDLRVSILPTMFGEAAVLRVLDRSNVSLELDKVGLRDDDLDTVRQLMKKPNGIVIVTGPTGSGKTTTLYSALNELNEVTEKICTAEDPVEYDIDGLVQVQVNPEVGLTFGAALRSFLRQDPDIILVGECRDLETAQISVQASLTGHLVFTTLHTNDAPSSIARLLDLGLENFLVTATIEGIVAQRLVRKVCDRCREAYAPSDEELFRLSLDPEEIQGREFYRGTGCDYCNQTGYRSRMGLFEIMVMDDELRELIMQNASTQLLQSAARRKGMRSLRESGLMAIYDGLTTIDEVARETLAIEEA